jgi:hypothetical protein
MIMVINRKSHEAVANLCAISSAPTKNDHEALQIAIAKATNSKVILSMFPPFYQMYAN